MGNLPITIKLVMCILSFIPFEIGVTGIFYSLINNYVYLPNTKGKFHKEAVPFLPRLYLFCSSLIAVVVGLFMVYPLAITIGII